MKPADPKQMANREERACARLEIRARNNTVLGGCSALILAKRAERLGVRFPAREVVADVYSASTGKRSPIWGAWECPECGAAHLGTDAALQCCAPSND